MIVDILTLFPAMFESPLNVSILKRAVDCGLIEVNTHDIRSYATDKHRTVDDTPFGGGPGMVMKPEPLYEAVMAVAADEEVLCGSEASPMDRSADSGRTFRLPIVFMTPQGERLTQQIVESLSKYDRMVVVCGHYEGVDERFRHEAVTDEISIGDYVLTGGELPAMVLIDAVARLLPGVLGEEEGYRNDSFYHGLLEHPQYTRPRVFRGIEVPEVLTQGNHSLIREFRVRESLRRTLKRRPDLLEAVDLPGEYRRILAEITGSDERD